MMKKFVDLIKNEDDFIYSNKEVLDIERIESEIGFSLADEYKEYIKQYGVAFSNGHEFTGAIESKRLGVVNATNRFWSKAEYDRTQKYVVEEIGVDGVVILQDSNGYVYQAAPNIEPVFIFDSLADYFYSDLSEE